MGRQIEPARVILRRSRHNQGLPFTVEVLDGPTDTEVLMARFRSPGEAAGYGRVLAHRAGVELRDYARRSDR